jgi:hypothetical protein
MLWVVGAPADRETLALSVRSVGNTFELRAPVDDRLTLYQNGKAKGRWAELAPAGLMMLPQEPGCFQLAGEGQIAGRPVSAAVQAAPTVCEAPWCAQVAAGPCQAACLRAAKVGCTPWHAYRLDTGLFTADEAPFTAHATGSTFVRSALKQRFVVRRFRRKTAQTTRVGDRILAPGVVEEAGYEGFDCAVEARIDSCGCPEPGCGEAEQRCEVEGYVVELE